MTDLTPRQILDAFQRGMEETWRKIDRGEIRRDGRLDWPRSAEAGEIVAVEKRSEMGDMTPRQILDAIERALDTTARRFANRKPDQTTPNTQPRPALEDAGDQSFESRRGS
jgi:hypothetical protein